MISDPSKRCVGILCVALANRFATNAEPTGDADKVSDLNAWGLPRTTPPFQQFSTINERHR
jgi:hypothetical protein